MVVGLTVVAELRCNGGGVVDWWRDYIAKGGGYKGRREEEKEKGKKM